MVFQYSYCIVSSWRYWSKRSHPVFWTAILASGWVAFDFLTVGRLQRIFPYMKGLPFALLALFGPAVLALILIAVSKRFINFTDNLSLHWLIIGFA